MNSESLNSTPLMTSLWIQTRALLKGQFIVFNIDLGFSLRLLALPWGAEFWGPFPLRPRSRGETGGVPCSLPHFSAPTISLRPVLPFSIPQTEIWAHPSPKPFLPTSFLLTPPIKTLRALGDPKVPLDIDPLGQAFHHLLIATQTLKKATWRRWRT